MTNLKDALHIPDTQSARDERHLAIQRVGVRGVRYPMQLRIGAAELSAVWTDPDFDPAQSAFWYVRVLEIPTPRWTAYDAAFFGGEMDTTVPAVQQERAYSSPIWYTPR